MITQRQAPVSSLKVRGFSLLEMLIVVAIIGLIATLVFSRLGGTLGKSKVKVTDAQIQAAAASIERFNMDVGRYPTEQEGFGVLLEEPADTPSWAGPYLDRDEIPTDGWDRALIYKPDERWGFRVLSLGADGQPGGDGENADLDNRSSRNAANTGS